MNCEHDTADVTAFADTHRKHLCVLCGEVTTGDHMPEVNVAEAMRLERKNERLIKSWGDE
jgi:hypothetical protein